MDLSPTEAEQEFRAEVRAWLRRTPAVGVRRRPPAAVRRPRRRGRASVGSGRRSSQRVGWVGVAWPEAYGGRGAGPVEHYIVQEELARARAPEFVGRIGINLAGPTLMAHGTEEQKLRWLPQHPRRDGDVVPALQRARRGQRPRQRHDEGHPGRRRMGAQRPEGVDVLRPVRRLGHLPGPDRPRRARSTRASRTSSSTCTLRASRSGRWCSSPARPSSTRCSSPTCSSPTTSSSAPRTTGWRVANSTLSHERGTNPRQLVIHFQLLEELLKLAADNGALDDPRLQQRLAEAYVEVRLFQLHNLRSRSAGWPRASTRVPRAARSSCTGAR